MPKNKGQFNKGHTLTPKGHKRALGYKHTEEAKVKIIASKRGKKRPKFSPEWIRKIKLAVKKRHQETNFGFQKGERNIIWKGGVSTLRERVRALFKNRQWRSDVFTRDNFTCQLCGAKDCKLEADHYPNPFYLILEEYKIQSVEEAIGCEKLWDINNGRTLCVDCHKKVTYGKS